MSRRLRKSRGAGQRNVAGIVVIVLILLVMAVAAGLNLFVRSYLQSDAFRVLLSRKASQALKVDGEFAPFRWEGLAVDTSRFTAMGNEAIREIQVEGLHTEVGLGGLSRGVWEIQGTHVQRVMIQLGERNQDRVENSPMEGTPILVKEDAAVQKKKKKKGWLPREVELQGVEINEFSMKAQLKQGEASITGTRLDIMPIAGRQSYEVDMRGGSIVLPYKKVPVMNLKKVQLRYQDHQAFLTNLEFSMFENAQLRATGEWNQLSDFYALQGDLTEVDCDELLDADWAKKISGKLSTDFTILNSNQELKANGHLVIHHGVLTALPILDVLAAYADTTRFRVISLSDAYADWRWRDGELLLSNLVIGSDGLIWLTGSISLRDEQLDGRFMLGIAPGILAAIPGAEQHVFTAGEKGLLWAPLHITGTLSDPKEDLKDRLIMAAGERMFEILPGTGLEVLKFSRNAFKDSPDTIIESSIRVLDGDSSVIQEAGSLFEQLIRGRSKKDEASSSSD